MIASMKNVVKVYGEVRVLDNLNLEIAEGEVWALRTKRGLTNIDKRYNHDNKEY